MRRAVPLLVAVACACTPAGPTDGWTPNVAAADSLVRSWVETERIPGAVLYVARDGEVLHGRARGAARLYALSPAPGAEVESRADGGSGPAPRRLDEPVPMTLETVFDLASVTKVLATTLAVMLLVDEGGIELDAPVVRYLHDFGGEGREQITVRHLLTHRSGLPQWLPVYYHAGDAEAAWDRVRTRRPSWPVGAERHYSDLGFMVLGRLVEEISGTPLDRFVRRRLYAPLGLERTGYRPTDGPAPHPDSALFAATSHGNPYERRMVHDPGFGYAIEGDPDSWSGWRQRTLVGEVNDGNAYHAWEGVAGHAGLFSTAEEAAALMRLVLDGGRSVDGRRILSAATVEAFLTDTGDGQALGWQLPPWAPPGAFGHTGFTGTFVLAVPERRLVIVLLTNRQNVGVDADTRYPDVGPLQRAVTAALAGAEPSATR